MAPRDPFLPLDEIVVHKDLEHVKVLFPRPAHVRILIVIEPGVDPGGAGFGLGLVASYLRNDSFGFVNFTVHFAERGFPAVGQNSVGPTDVVYVQGHADDQARYTSFRFHSVLNGKHVIDGYDEIWCFGLNPIIHDNGSNSDVENHVLSPDNAELTVLSDWMDAGGGVLAMGDHNFLGSAMCWNMPRVGTMRAWRKDTNDDARSVPNRTGTDRHDTNRPDGPGQTWNPISNPTPQQMPNTNETDTVCQPLEWKRYQTWSIWLNKTREYPHPVLCGGSLGVIDVFPDHPHEGLVIHEDHIALGATCLHDSTKAEYPTVGGVQPSPEVVAWVNTLADPPWNHQKGNQPARRVPAVGVYDGHTIEHGRVVVDSTWHHWFNYNIAKLDAADSTDFKKIRRYFENVAVWLAPKDEQQRMLRYGTWWTVLSNVAFMELDLNTPIFVLGGQAIDILGRRTSHCIVESWIWSWLPFELIELELKLRKVPDPCWTCPPDDLFLRAVMGHAIRELLPHRDRLLRAHWTDREARFDFDPSVLDEVFEVALRRGIEDGLELMEANRRPLSTRINRLRKGIVAFDERRKAEGAAAATESDKAE